MKVFILFGLFGLLAGCAEGFEAGGTATPVPTVTLQRFPTSTLREPQAPGEQPELEATTPPLPTPTPIFYTVVENDTMLGIADRYNLALDELLSANPDVDPRAMSVGTELFIPVGDVVESPAALPTPTAAPALLAEPDCYATIDGGLWCFALAENAGAGALENLSAILYLYDEDGSLLQDYGASAPLNLLAPGQRMPLAVFIDAPPEGWAISQAQLVTALGVASEGRYLETQLQEVMVEISGDGLSAAVQGEVRLADREATANVVWVLAVAYDAEGKIVGLRRWEYARAFPGAEVLPFALQVFSLGAGIEMVEILVEARP
ncbi:MAG: LysM peptidoglycan-binding domain-containing protein [Chloroflexi bacterium]|nr:LysM peptidoglycan-binding domain-containing protein [Chloroflexota bacterium]